MSAFAILGFFSLAGSAGLGAALIEYFLYMLLPIPVSEKALLMSQPGLGLSAFIPRRLFAPVLLLNQFLEWSVLIPSLPDWDQ